MAKRNADVTTTCATDVLRSRS